MANTTTKTTQRGRPTLPKGEVYKARYNDGWHDSVVLTNARFTCTSCGKLKGAKYFGLRYDNGVIRNQAQCTTCRNGG